MRFNIILFILSLGIATAVSAQNPFRPETKTPNPPKSSFANMAEVPVPADFFVNAYRFTANFSPGAYTFNGTYQLLAGMEYGLQHQKWNSATKKYTVVWSINVAWFPINSANKVTSLKDLSSLGPTFGWHNNLFQVGPLWNPNAPKGQQVGVQFTFGYTLNN